MLYVDEDSIHISVEFSQKIDKSCGECRESEEFSSRCNCTRCTLSRRSSRVKSASTSASPRGFSISSPAISLPKIKSQPRTCSRSCGRISNAKKQVERSLSCRTNSCCKRLKRREDSSGDDEAMNRRQVDQRYEINRCFGSLWLRGMFTSLFLAFLLSFAPRNFFDRHFFKLLIFVRRDIFEETMITRSCLLLFSLQYRENDGWEKIIVHNNRSISSEICYQRWTGSERQEKNEVNVTKKTFHNELFIHSASLWILFFTSCKKRGRIDENYIRKTGKSGIQNFGKVQHGVEQLHLRERIGSMGYILHDRHAFPEKIGETLRARGAGGNSTNLEGDADQIEGNRNRKLKSGEKETRGGKKKGKAKNKDKTTTSTPLWNKNRIYNLNSKRERWRRMSRRRYRVELFQIREETYSRNPIPSSSPPFMHNR